MKTHAVLLAAGAGLAIPGAAHAAITINIAQVGGNVVATGSGTFNTTGLPASSTTANYSIIINGSRGGVLVGTQIDTVRYTFASGPTGFGTINTFYFADSSSGNTFGVYGTDSALHLPVGYVSGAALSGSATYNNLTLAAMGLTQGTYVYTFANDRVTVIVGPAAAVVPEPASWALMIAGFGAAGAAMRVRRRSMAVSTTA